MLNKMYAIIASLFMLLLFVPATIYGELDATLWIPDKTLLKQSYSGLITLNEKQDIDMVFSIVTDNEEVIELLTEEVTIPKEKRHGVIEFNTVGGGNAEIFAIAKDRLLSDSIEVVESAADPTQLKLFLPSSFINILTDDNVQQGYIFLNNDFDKPIPTSKPIEITLTSNGEITLLESTVTIQPNEHYAKFSFTAMGDGTITASAPNLLPDEEEATIDDLEEIELIIEVAPDPIPTDSSAEIYFWLERDSKPYLPPHDVKVTISIDKSFNLSFDSAIKGAIILTPDSTSERRTDNADATEIITRTEASLSRDASKEFIIKAGTYYGKLQVYSSFDSGSGITLNGLAESINPKLDEEVIKSSESLSVSTESSNFLTGKETRVFAFPDPAYDKVEIVVSSHSGEGPTIESDDEPFVVFTDNSLSLDVDNVNVIKTDQNYAIAYASVVDFGDASIYAERNEATSEEIEITTKGKYVKDPELEIVALPILFDTEQDLFLVVSAHDKIKTDVNSPQEGNVVSITSRPFINFEATSDGESIIVVRGKISEILENDPEIHVTSNAETITETLEVYNIDRKKLESEHPRDVYPEEFFPLITHITDLDSNLIKKSNLSVSSDAEMFIDGDFAYFNDTGRHDIIFYEKNSVPIESNINVKGHKEARAQAAAQIKLTEEQIRQQLIPKYNIEVSGGSGSGIYEEGQNVTLSTMPTKEDYFLFKKSFERWENLPYKESDTTFVADDDITTKPIYRDDFSGLFLVLGSGGAIGGIIFMKMQQNKKSSKEKDEIDFDSLLGD